jgi:hypothetical protein
VGGKSDRENFKHMYHPYGDPRNVPKRTPEALNSVIIGEVSLPKVIMDVLLFFFFGGGLEI